MKPDENGSREGACHLRNKIWRELRKVTTGYSKAHDHRRIQMRIVAAARDRGKNTRHDGERPPTCDDHPACAFCFRTFEQNVCDYAITEQYQDERTHELSETITQHLQSPLRLKLCSLQSVQSNDLHTARFQSLYICSRFPFVRFGFQVWSTDQFARRSATSLKYPTARPAV